VFGETESGSQNRKEVHLKFQESSNASIDELVRLVQENLENELEGQSLTFPEMDEVIADGSDIEPEEKTDASLFDPLSRIRMEGKRKRVGERPAPRPYNLVAVDSGIVGLGELEGGGTCFAVRAAAIVVPDNEGVVTLLKYNTGPLVLGQANRIPVFRFIGRRLGKEDLYIDTSVNPPVERDSAIALANQLQDRVRNFVERMVQEEATGVLAAMQGGVLLIDGALPAATFDTPRMYTKGLLRKAQENGIDVVALSKKTRIAVGGRPLATLFSGKNYETFTGYASLKDQLALERNSSSSSGRTVNDITSAEQIYAARFAFGPQAITFRVDVNPRAGRTADEAMEAFFNGAEFYGGYPRALIDAHHQSVFLSGDPLTMRAELVAKYGLRPQPVPDLNHLFQPYGAFGK
jgi:hypothetical protein